MRSLHTTRKLVAALVIVALGALSISWAPAHAAMISTAEILKQTQQDHERDRVRMFFDRSEVRRQLEAWGVKGEEAKAWVDSLTDEEIAEITARIDQMPAGAGALGTLVGVAFLVFLVLLITDILGYTDVFPFIKAR
jgi:hypothetical protein